MDILRLDRLDGHNIPNTDRYGIHFVEPESGKKTILDKTNRYIFNSLGFRGEDFSKNKDMVAIGCSFTLGQGVPYERVWSSVVADALGVEYDNLGVRGASVHQIVAGFLEYCKRFGTPKQVYALMPSFYRAVFAGHPLDIGSDSSLPKYSKFPHKPESIITRDFGIWQALTTIRFLEEYCRAAGISLAWSTWDGDAKDCVQEILEQKISFFTNYVNTPHIGDRLDGCHQELREMYPNNFDAGTDVELGESHIHWGVHQHAHFAQSFLDAR